MNEPLLSGAAKWLIVHGDNLAVMRAAPPASVHLVFGDAPYNTGETFKMRSGEVAYEDRFPSLEAYLEHLRERSAAARDLLTDDGCFVLQVDPNYSHYVKVMLDGVFGRDCYRNEIVWRYRRWPSPGPNFQRMHDTIFRYTKHSKQQRWNQLFEPLSPKTIAIHGTKRQKHAKTEAGRKWGKWTGPSEEESPGAYMSDVWEIGVIAPKSASRLYPTQKPPEIARRIVSACSLPSDVVLDPWCGSGTHVSVAVELERLGVGIDQSAVAVRVAQERLRNEEAARERRQRELQAREAQMDLFGAG